MVSRDVIQANNSRSNEKEKNRFIFDQAIRTADILVNMFGQRCEVAVHDFNDINHSLIHVSGTVTQRKIGAPITDLVLRELKKPSEEIRDIPNYTTTYKGLAVKSSTVFLRDSENMIIGALCINFDISLWSQLSRELQNFINIESNEEVTETFYSSVKEIIEGLIKTALSEYSKPPSQFDMEEKIEFVKKLEEKGTFQIKGSTEYVATVLGVSKFTIYNYLTKIKVKEEYKFEGES